jgi:hypothetical protein
VVHRTTDAASLALLLLAACNGSSGTSSADPPCVAGLDAGCAATYDPPTYGAIYTSILVPNCAVGTGTCHTSDFAPDGLVFADETASYDTLLGGDGGTPLVLPGNPGCSTLMKRLESTDPDYHMPKGPSFLAAGDLCTIVQWISQGAPR